MKNKILIVLCVLSGHFFGQTILGVDTLVKNGPINKRINLVIMGDGYTTAEMGQFITNATTLSTYLLNTSPFNNYKRYFNVFAIKCPSPQSGVSHPGTAPDVTEPASPTLAVTNNFNTRFDNWNTHRLIYAMNPSAVYSVLASAFPAYDQIIILGNSTEYGGAGGAFGVLSIHQSAPEILAHEMGHSFAGLADEYWSGAMNERPNMTANSNSTSIKWSQWLGTTGVGIHPFDTVAPGMNWYRPHQNCKMQFLNKNFCAVCKQAIIEKIHSLTDPIDSYSPDNTSSITYTASSQWFRTKMIRPNPNTLKRVWTLNTDVIAYNKDSLLLGDNLFANGDNALLLTVMDTTLLSRDDDHQNLHSYSVLWTINYQSTVGIKEIKSQMEFSMFPNPASDLLNLNYTLWSEAQVGISIMDMSGKIIYSEKTRRSPAGDYKQTLDIGQFKEGNYILVLRVNNQTINNKFIIVK